MKRTIIFLAVLFFATAVALPALAQDELPPASTMPAQSYSEPPGDYIILDALVLRPLGLAAMGIGAIGAVVAAPWAASSHSECVVEHELIQKPYSYTFCRPLGDIDP